MGLHGKRQCLAKTAILYSQSLERCSRSQGAVLASIPPETTFDNCHRPCYLSVICTPLKTLLTCWRNEPFCSIHPFDFTVQHKYERFNVIPW